MVYAQINLSDPAQNPIAKFDSLGTILNLIIPLITVGASLLFLVMILSAAFTILTSGGNSEKIGKAQKNLIFAIIGLIIVIFAYIFVKLIGRVFNISLPL